MPARRCECSALCAAVMLHTTRLVPLHDFIDLVRRRPPLPLSCGASTRYKLVTEEDLAEAVRWYAQGWFLARVRR